MVPRLTSVIAAALTVVTAAALVACGNNPDTGPSAEGWRQDWDAIVGLVPPRDALGTDPEQLCSDTLGALRAARPELPPVPDPSLVGLVEDWFELAESTFFECPPDGGDIVGFDAAYDELARYEAGVDASLDNDKDR